MADPLTNEEAASNMEAYIKYHASQMSPDNFDVTFLHTVKARSAQVASPGVTAKATFAFNMPPTYRNRPYGPATTHGGAIATFFDWLTSMAVVATNFPGWESTGVTRRLDVTYFKPPIEGEVTLVEAEVLQIGKRMATIRGVMRRESDGAVVAVCQHDKVLAPVPEGRKPGKKPAKL